jgi:hypothetical protein
MEDKSISNDDDDDDDDADMVGFLWSAAFI